MNTNFNTISNLNNRVAVEMLEANKSVWGGRITYTNNKADGTVAAKFTQGGEVIAAAVGSSKDGAKIALAHALNA